MKESSARLVIAVLADNTLATVNRILSVLRARQCDVRSLTFARTRASDTLAISIATGSSSKLAQRFVAWLDKVEEV
jgi:acetolactate synthase small subunit